MRCYFEIFSNAREASKLESRHGATFRSIISRKVYLLTTLTYFFPEYILFLLARLAANLGRYKFTEVYKSAHSEEEQKHQDRFVKIRFKGYHSTGQITFLF